MLLQEQASSLKLCLRTLVKCWWWICSALCHPHLMRTQGLKPLTQKKKSLPWSLLGHICKLCTSFCCAMLCPLRLMQSLQKGTLTSHLCWGFWTCLTLRIQEKENTWKPYCTAFMVSSWFTVPLSGRQSTTSSISSFLRLKGTMVWLSCWRFLAASSMALLYLSKKSTSSFWPEHWFLCTNQNVCQCIISSSLIVLFSLLRRTTSLQTLLSGACSSIGLWQTAKRKSCFLESWKRCWRPPKLQNFSGVWFHCSDNSVGASIAHTSRWTLTHIWHISSTYFRWLYWLCMMMFLQSRLSS